ncbi:hypothetical protein [Bacillus sp. Marseille-P3661]|uniref:hypothetical protein n=1 Tax=Bacillus sp. Marseille-P3661 TaxID=1936234 RepID=UPI000C85F451|nr:hypothetical protein [Bacillus sp. Marseille-P3661]
MGRKNRKQILETSQTRKEPETAYFDWYTPFMKRLIENEFPHLKRPKYKPPYSMKYRERGGNNRSSTSGHKYQNNKPPLNGDIRMGYRQRDGRSVEKGSQDNREQGYRRRNRSNG